VRNDPVQEMFCVVKCETPPVLRWKLCEFQHRKSTSISGINLIMWRGLIRRLSVRFRLQSENTSSHGLELHRPSRKGIELRLHVIKAINIVILARAIISFAFHFDSVFLKSLRLMDAREYNSFDYLVTGQCHAESVRKLLVSGLPESITERTWKWICTVISQLKLLGH